jgi:hypothetical protein
MAENPDDVAPYKYGEAGKLAMQKVVEEKLKVFSRIK